MQAASSERWQKDVSSKLAAARAQKGRKCLVDVRDGEAAGQTRHLEDGKDGRDMRQQSMILRKCKNGYTAAGAAGMKSLQIVAGQVPKHDAQQLQRKFAKISKRWPINPTSKSRDSILWHLPVVLKVTRIHHGPRSGWNSSRQPFELLFVGDFVHI